MWSPVVSIVLGFVLTTVIGGAFASYLQQRSWHHQNRARLVEEERQKASDVCTALSELIDKRCYRMRRLLWAIDGHAQGRVSEQELRERLRDYQQLLFEWNDQLNTRLAIVGAYFGGDVREYLDTVIYERFQEAGRTLEALYRQVTGNNPDASGTEASTQAARILDALGEYAYQFSFTMMLRIREGKVGRGAPRLLTTADLHAHEIVEREAPQ